MNKYIKLDEFEALVQLIKERDIYYDHTMEYHSLDNKITITIEELRKNAITSEELKWTYLIGYKKI